MFSHLDMTWTWLSVPHVFIPSGLARSYLSGDVMNERFTLQVRERLLGDFG